MFGGPASHWSGGHVLLSDKGGGCLGAEDLASVAKYCYTSVPTDQVTFLFYVMRDVTCTSSLAPQKGLKIIQ
jgi:hypothetical protein